MIRLLARQGRSSACRKSEMQPNLPWQCLGKSDAKVARSLSKLNRIHSRELDIFGRRKRVPANQRGRSFRFAGYFYGSHVTQPCGIALARIPLRESFDVRNSINSSPPTLSSTPTKTVDSDLSTPNSCESTLLFTNTFCASLSTAEPKHEYPCAVVSASRSHGPKPVRG